MERLSALDELVVKLGLLGWEIEEYTQARVVMFSPRTGQTIYLRLRRDGVIEQGGDIQLDLSELDGRQSRQITRPYARPSARPMLAGGPRRNVPVAVFVAILMAFPAAVLFGLILGLIVGGGTIGGTIMAWGILVGLVGFSFLFAYGALLPHKSFRRGLLTVGLESFLFPLVALVFTAVAGSRSLADSPNDASAAGAAIGLGLAGFVLVVMGIGIAIAIGVPCIVLYFVVGGHE